MKSYPITIRPFGESAILIEWPAVVDEKILEDILQFNRLLQMEFDASWEVVPAYNSLTLINNVDSIEFQKVENTLARLYAELDYGAKADRFLWTLPVCYDLEFGIDAEDVAAKLNIGLDELIERHSSYEYTVFGIGFLPGFMYLGGLPKNLEINRKATPRLKVGKGAVGLAGKQTGIYPQDSPGGWNIIGNCPIPMFNVKAKKPCFVSVGDKIKFKPISKAEHQLYKIEGEVGIYEPEKTPLNG